MTGFKSTVFPTFVFFLIRFLGQAKASVSSSVVLEVETAEFKDNRVIVRSAASGGRTFHLQKDDTIQLEFCLMKDTSVLVNDIRYSNDGASDHVKVGLDYQVVGDFHSDVLHDHGRGWNHFKSTGPLNHPVMLGEGRHRVTLTVLDSDQYGLEVDTLELLVQGNQNEASLKCDVFCFDDIQYPDDLPFRSQNRSKGRIEQRSEVTDCAEKDNVNIPIFHPSARRYIVSASFPKYPTFKNYRDPDFTNCKMLDGRLWKFEDVQFFAFVKTNFTRMAGPAVLVGENNLHTATAEVTFSLEGPSTLSTDSEIGSTVRLALDPLTIKVTATMTYYSKYRVWSSPQNVSLGPHNLNASWDIPDFSWNQGQGNKVKVVFQKESAGDIKVRSVRMYRRTLAWDKVTRVFEDGFTIIEVLAVDMWWRVNETMRVISAGQSGSFSNVHYMRIYKKVPWMTNGYSQVFVLYQDGYVRLLPPNPDGVDWVPFGSSIIIGQTNYTSTRPSAPIKLVEVNPYSLEIKIRFVDGGRTSLQLKTTIQETRMLIVDSTYQQDLNLHPFMTFRSMWVSDGNADADHVNADGKNVKSIMGNWTSMRGTYFAFFRQCISKHNTQSPDIRVKIIA